MFPFGSLLTQVPLIIIGALYMLYLGLYTFNRSKDRIELAENHSDIQFVSGISEKNADDLFSIVFDKDDMPSDLPADIRLPRSYALYINSYCHIPDSGIPSLYSSLSLFARPPPPEA
jgi:hypothetical protein